MTDGMDYTNTHPTPTLEQQLHRAMANRGLGAAKIVDRWLKAKAGTWNCPEREAEAMALYAELTGRTMASHRAALVDMGRAA